MILLFGCLFQAAAAVGQVATNTQLGNDSIPPLLATQRAQAEPHIIRSCTDPNFLVAIFHEGTYASGGGATDDGYAVSRDGGSTWTRALIPKLTQASGGTYDRASDPVAAIDLNENIYLNAIVSIQGVFTRIVVSKSSDYGTTVGNPNIVYDAPAGSGINPDKNWLSINTFPNTPHPNRLLVTFFLNTGTDAPVVRSYSDNGGVTWSPAAYMTSSTASCDGPRPVFLANGKTAVAYSESTNSSTTFQLKVAISSDGGTAFGPPITVATPQLYQISTIRTQKGNPAIAADRTTGNLYVAYQALDSNYYPRIFFTKSTNTGASWSTPKVISDNPAGSPVYNAAISASPDGNVITVVFYDMRLNPTSKRYVDLYMTQSTDGGTTWRPNFRVSSVTSDVTLAPKTSGGYMMGDYLAVTEAISPNVPAVAVWIDTRNGNADPFVAKAGVYLTSPPQAVVSYALINADTNLPIQPLNNGNNLNLATLPTGNLNIRANTSPVTVGSVVFTLTGPQTRNATDANGPYSLFGDTSGDYNPWNPAAGSYTLAAAPFTGNGSGTMGSALAINFTVLNAPITPGIAPPAVVSYTLVNADTDRDIQSLADGITLNLTTLPTRNLNVRANTTPAVVGSVAFALTGPQSRSTNENNAPYSLWGDDSGNYRPWTPAAGSYTLKATPFPAASGGGSPGTSLKINFSVVSQ